jgi:hypothetical protein
VWGKFFTFQLFHLFYLILRILPAILKILDKKNLLENKKNNICQEKMDVSTTRREGNINFFYKNKECKKMEKIKI